MKNSNCSNSPQRLILFDPQKSCSNNKIQALKTCWNQSFDGRSKLIECSEIKEACESLCQVVQSQLKVGQDEVKITKEIEAALSDQGMPANSSNPLKVGIVEDNPKYWPMFEVLLKFTIVEIYSDILFMEPPNIDRQVAQIFVAIPRPDINVFPIFDKESVKNLGNMSVVKIAQCIFDAEIDILLCDIYFEKPPSTYKNNYYEASNEQWIIEKPKGAHTIRELYKRNWGKPTISFSRMWSHPSFQNHVVNELLFSKECHVFPKPRSVFKKRGTTFNAYIHSVLTRTKKKLGGSIPTEKDLFDDKFIGSSMAMSRVKNFARTVAMNDKRPIFITGDTGTGKSVLAEAIHAHSPRKRQKFQLFNCVEQTADLFVSELFGVKEGAYTGAKSRIGYAQEANTGTLFLDEIGEAPKDIQVKLLRLIDKDEFELVGSTTTIHVDLRIISATNIEKKKFKEKLRPDLERRLGFKIHIPSLSERSEDIEELIIALLGRHYNQFPNNPLIAKIRESMDIYKLIDRISLDALKKYKWPGNVGELDNKLEDYLMCYPEHEFISSGYLFDLFPEVVPNCKSIESEWDRNSDVVETEPTNKKDSCNCTLDLFTKKPMPYLNNKSIEPPTVIKVFGEKRLHELANLMVLSHNNGGWEGLTEEFRKAKHWMCCYYPGMLKCKFNKMHVNGEKLSDSFVKKCLMASTINGFQHEGKPINVTELCEKYKDNYCSNCEHKPSCIEDDTK